MSFDLLTRPILGGRHRLSVDGHPAANVDLRQTFLPPVHLPRNDGIKIGLERVQSSSSKRDALGRRRELWMSLLELRRGPSTRENDPTRADDGIRTRDPHLGKVMGNPL